MKKQRQHFHYDHEVDLHGLHSDEAWNRLEHLIYSYPGSSILVVHGRGDGVLRSRIRMLAVENSGVSEMVFGENNNIPGGDGVTVIYTS